MNPQLLSQRALSTLLKSLLIALFVCAMLWGVGRQTTVVAQTEPTAQTLQNMTKLWHWGGLISTMTPVSDTLYVGMGQDLVIFDIAAPTSPKLLGQLSLDASVYDIEIVGIHALIATDRHGLLIVDIGDKQAPRWVAERHDLYTVERIVVAAPYAYAAYSNGIEILDISDPAAPIVITPRIAGLDFEPADLQIAGNHLFVAGGVFELGTYTYRTWGVLQAFDLADPTVPTPLPAYRTEPSIESEKRFYNLRLQGDNAYAVQSDSISRFAITTPSAITLSSQLNLASLQPSTSTVLGDQLYIAKHSSTRNDDGGLYILDASSSPTITVSDFLTQPVNAIAVQGNYAFVGRNDDGLHVWDVTKPLAPQKIGGYRTVVSIWNGDLVAHAPFLYVTGGVIGTPLLSTIDLRNPAQPTLTTVITSSDRTGFYPFIDGNWLTLSAASSDEYNFDNFQLFDITNPGVPQRIARYETAPFTSAAYADHRLYLETLDRVLPSAQISVFDLSAPTTPVITQIIPTAPQVMLLNFNDLNVSTRYLYYLGGDSRKNPVSGQPYYLYVYDLDNALVTTTLEMPWTYSLYHYADTLYGVTFTAHGACHYPIYMIDVAEPATPRIRQNYCWNTVITDLLRDDHLLYIADRSLDYYGDSHNSGLSVIDFAIPHAPRLAGYARERNVQPQLAKIDDTVYFLGDGLSAYRYTPPQVMAQLDHGGSLTADFDNVTYAFPPATFTVPVTVTHTTHFVDPWLAFPAPQFGIGHAFSLVSTALDTGETVQPTAAFSLTITYPDEAVQFIDETTLALYRWVDGVWVLEKSSVVDPATNTVIASPTTTGIWMLGAVLKNRSYFPLIGHQKNK